MGKLKRIWLTVIIAAFAFAQYSPPAGGGGGGGGVTSFNSRTGAVVPATSDYAVSQLGDFVTTRTSATRITVADGALGIPYTGGIIDIAAGVGTGTVYVYGSNLTETLHVSSFGLDNSKISASAAITVDPDAAAMNGDFSNVFVWSWEVTSDAFDVAGGFDQRNIIGDRVIFAGEGRGIAILSTAPGSIEIGLTDDVSTGSNCSSATSPAACGSASAGSVAVPAGVNPTLVVQSTAVTDDSQIILMPDSSLGTKLSVTCNTTVPALVKISDRTAATSFTIAITATVAANPVCYSYVIVN